MKYLILVFIPLAGCSLSQGSFEQAMSDAAYSCEGNSEYSMIKGSSTTMRFKCTGG